jgi:ribosomal protein L7/L12
VNDREAHLRIARLEFLVSNLYKATGTEMPGEGVGPQGEISAEVTQLIADGDPIAAIKQYRAETGVGLAEAKAALGLGSMGD